MFVPVGIVCPEAGGGIVALEEVALEVVALEMFPPDATLKVLRYVRNP